MFYEQGYRKRTYQLIYHFGKREAFRLSFIFPDLIMVHTFVRCFVYPIENCATPLIYIPTMIEPLHVVFFL